MAICNLAVEMRLEILDKLSLHELVFNCSKTCHQWRNDISHHILAPKIRTLANAHNMFKMIIFAKGWQETSANTTELLLSLYAEYEVFASKYFFC